MHFDRSAWLKSLASTLESMPDNLNAQPFERVQLLLPEARTESLHVAATFADIRGFSAFAVRGSSFDAAYYLRAVYSAILKDRFSDRDYFKLTGDGLMLIHHLPTSTEDWPRVMRSLVERARVLVNDFGQITAHDYAVVPPVPQCLGIGIARGHATRLVSGGITLDYTGPCLNLAARLMDKARPSGVVISDTHCEAMFGDELSELTADAVCIRGISDEVPITIFATRDVVIQQRDREPLTGLRRIWSGSEEVSVADARKYDSYPFYLERQPQSDEVAEVRVAYDEYKNGEVDGNYFFEEGGKLEEGPDGWLIRLNLGQTQQRISSSPEQSFALGGFLHFTNKVTFRAYIRPADE